MERVGIGAEEVEHDIPPCIVSMRLDHPNNRTARNPLPGTENGGDYRYQQSGYFINAGDGRIHFICPGFPELDCQGGQVTAECQDLFVQPGMPETTRTLGRICTSPHGYWREGSVLREYFVDDDGLEPDDQTSGPDLTGVGEPVSIPPATFGDLGLNDLDLEEPPSFLAHPDDVSGSVMVKDLENLVGGPLEPGAADRLARMDTPLDELLS